MISARTPLELERDELLASLDDAVCKLDAADREYRVAIERILPPDRALQMLSAMDAFRGEVIDIREKTRVAGGYGEFDPLDTYIPSFGRSHADAVRSANLGDRAREAVADARARINAQVALQMTERELDALLDAKESRAEAFEAAIDQALPRDVSKRLRSQLVLLAEGWY